MFLFCSITFHKKQKGNWTIIQNYIKKIYTLGWKDSPVSEVLVLHAVDRSSIPCTVYGLPRSGIIPGVISEHSWVYLKKQEKIIIKGLWHNLLI